MDKKEDAMESTSQETTKRMRRSEEVPVIFDPETGLAIDWAFGVSTAFKAALDIKQTPRVKPHPTREGVKIETSVETVGVPQLYSFSAGDIFHTPALTQNRPWADHLEGPSTSLQIQNATPDSAKEKGTVSLEIITYHQGAITSKKTETMTQAAFAAVLQTGLK